MKDNKKVTRLVICGKCGFEEKKTTYPDVFRVGVFWCKKCGSPQIFSTLEELRQKVKVNFT